MIKMLMAAALLFTLAGFTVPAAAEKITRSQCLKECNEKYDSCSANVSGQRLDGKKLENQLKRCKADNKDCKKTCVKKH